MLHVETVQLSGAKVIDVWQRQGDRQNTKKRIVMALLNTAGDVTENTGHSKDMRMQ